MENQIVAVSTDNVAVLDIIRRTFTAYRETIGDPTTFEVVSIFVKGEKFKGFDSMIREAHRVAQTARKTCNAHIGLGITEGDAELLINRGARRIFLTTWPIIAVIEHGPIGIAFPNRFPNHVMEPIRLAIRAPFVTLRKPECTGVPDGIVAATTIAITAWSEMRFPSPELKEQRLG